MPVRESSVPTALAGTHSIFKERSGGPLLCFGRFGEMGLFRHLFLVLVSESAESAMQMADMTASCCCSLSVLFVADRCSNPDLERFFVWPQVIDGIGVINIFRRVLKC